MHTAEPDECIVQFRHAGGKRPLPIGQRKAQVPGEPARYSPVQPLVEPILMHSAPMMDTGGVRQQHDVDLLSTSTLGSLLHMGSPAPTLEAALSMPFLFAQDAPHASQNYSNTSDDQSQGLLGTAHSPPGLPSVTPAVQMDAENHTTYTSQTTASPELAESLHSDIGRTLKLAMEQEASSPALLLGRLPSGAHNLPNGQRSYSSEAGSEYLAQSLSGYLSEGAVETLPPGLSQADLQAPAMLAKEWDPPIPKPTAIAELQEALQTSKCSRLFRYPPGAQVLQWSHVERRGFGGQAMFRAVVAFLCDGVGHHVAGHWQRCKKHSRHDAADIFLQIMRRCWARPVPANCGAPSVFVDLGDRLLLAHSRNKAAHHTTASAATLVDLLQETCAQHAETRCAADGVPAEPKWSWQQGGPEAWQALVELPLWGVHYMFAGTVCSSQDQAMKETARRVLWYLGGAAPHVTENTFVPDSSTLLRTECKVSLPPKCWADLVGIEIT